MPELSDSFYRQLCNHTSAGIIAADGQLVIRFCNNAAARILGGSPSSIVGESLNSIVPAERRVLARKLFDRTLRRLESSELEFSYHDPAGQPLHLGASISPIIDDQKTILGLTVVIHNVTWRVETQKAQAHARKMSALGTMAGAVAHYFNNMLGTLVPSVDLARKHEDPAAWRAALGVVIAQLTRAGRLTHGLRAFAEGAHHPSPQINLAEVTRLFAEELEAKVAGSGIRIEYDLEPVDCTVPETQMTAVLEHLCANACEAMSNGGLLRIEVLSAAEGRTAQLRICDTGCGIPENQRDRLFEPFFTTKAEPASASAQHLGLGLAIVHGMVHAMGGTVTLTSNPETGTHCCVELPATAAQAEEEA